MSVNKNVSICVATSPGLLIKVAANRTGQKAVGPFIRAAHTSYVRRRYRAGARWMAALLATERDDGLAVHQLERVTTRTRPAAHSRRTRPSHSHETTGTKPTIG